MIFKSLNALNTSIKMEIFPGKHTDANIMNIIYI